MRKKGKRVMNVRSGILGRKGAVTARKRGTRYEGSKNKTIGKEGDAMFEVGEGQPTQKKKKKEAQGSIS